MRRNTAWYKNKSLIQQLEESLTEHSTFQRTALRFMLALLK